MKTVLIPTDFSLGSLNVAKTVIEKYAQNNSKVNVLMVHAVDISDSITDLLFFSKGKMLSQLSDTPFKEGCSVLRNGFSEHLNSLRVDLFTGFTQSSFNAYLHANQVDTILYAEPKLFQRTHKSSVDVHRFFSKAPCKVEYIQHSATEMGYNKGSIAQLLKV